MNYEQENKNTLMPETVFLQAQTLANGHLGTITAGVMVERFAYYGHFDRERREEHSLFSRPLHSALPNQYRG